MFVDSADKYHGAIDPLPGAQRRLPLAYTILACVYVAVERCEPAVRALPQLLESLNTGNDFSLFVRSMRKQFKDQL